MRQAVFTLVLALLVCLARGQRQTVVDDNGNTVVESVVTDANGDPSSTRILSTIGATSAAASTTAANPGGGIGQGGAAADATQNTCTTAGCPTPPILYTQNGVVMTFVPTTPPTPSPTFATTGTIVPISQYITTTVSGKAFSGAVSNRFEFPSFRDSSVLLALTAGASIAFGALFVL